MDADPGTLELDASYRTLLSENLPRLRERMAAAAGDAGRSPQEIRLVAVTKGHPLAAVEAALEAGLTDLGENRVGELEEKAAAIGPDRVTWHMIGHIQRRKAPRAMEAADLIHSLDSPRLARRFSRVATEAEREVEALVQVNTSGEESKGGFEGPEVVERILEAATLPGLRICGLMTMAPFVEDEEVLRGTFRRLREISEELRSRSGAVGPELSMGMTNDLEIAIREGSTMIRIGTALFGERSE
jgi:hypothetical protein